MDGTKVQGGSLSNIYVAVVHARDQITERVC